MDRLKDQENSEDSVLERGFHFGSSGSGMRFPVGKLNVESLVDEGHRSGKITKRLMLCKVAVGRAYNAHDDFARIAAIPDGYDSFVLDQERSHQDAHAGDESNSSNYETASLPGLLEQIQSRKPGHGRDTLPDAFEYIVKDSSQILPTFIVIFEFDPESERRSRQKVSCENCERRLATVFCQSDAANLCDQCDAEMHTSKLASRHARVPLEGSGAQTFSHCRIHPDKIVEFFCPSCSRPVCVHCKMVGHHATGEAARHKLITVAEAYKSVAESANATDPILDSRKLSIRNQQSAVEERAQQVIANAATIQSQLDELYRRAQSDLKALLKKKLNILRGDSVELERELVEINHLEAFLNYQKSGPNATQFILDWAHHQRLRSELHSFPFFRETIDVLPDIRVQGAIQVHVESASAHGASGLAGNVANLNASMAALAAGNARPRATPTIDLAAYKVRKATDYVADIPNLAASNVNNSSPQYAPLLQQHERKATAK